MAELIPGATATIIPNAGHYPWYEQPRALQRSIKGFISTLPG
jgi:pimeloyl-ACP methyl ester carboxylesterase